MLTLTSDPLPWQCFTRYQACCTNTVFVDIDYRDLMLKKRAVVQSTSELNAMLSNVEVSEGDVLFKSDQYVQLGCDLRNLAALQNTLSRVADIENCKSEHITSFTSFRGGNFS